MVSFNSDTESDKGHSSQNLSSDDDKPSKP